MSENSITGVAFINFNGKAFFTRKIGDVTVAEDALNEELYSEGKGYVSNEARELDETIYGYLPKTDIISKSDKAIMKMAKEVLELNT